MNCSRNKVYYLSEIVWSNNSSMIQTENLTKRFGSTLAVERLNLSIEQGEVFGFLGPNGAGKTTTVRMLASLISPTQGRAVVNGFEVGRQDDQIRRSVGVLTETPGLYDNLSAEYNLRIFAELYEVRDPAGQVEKYLRMLGLWERRFEPTATFSKGMKQKLAIARALLHEPKVLFLDEPTAALDPESARLVRDFIAELRREGRTIFLCTHNLDEADRLCDRIAVFKTRLLVVDTPERLRQQMFGRKVVFHLRNLDEAMLSKVSELPFVSEARMVDGRLLVTLDDPEKRNPEIVRQLVMEGAEIQFVGELRYSLEEVYLRLVRNDGAPAT
jgi:ABC-2 type transport system ATP-binding protein